MAWESARGYSPDPGAVIYDNLGFNMDVTDNANPSVGQDPFGLDKLIANGDADNGRGPSAVEESPVDDNPGNGANGNAEGPRQPKVCRNCGESGHGIAKCENARKIDRSDVPDLTPEAAWDAIIQAVKEADVEDAKSAIQALSKAEPETTYVDLEKSFREKDIGLWLIAIHKEHLAITLTNMDLQGNLNKKYTVTYRFAPKCTRPREKALWPASAEENLERLRDAGDIVARSIPKCNNCGQLGHIASSCPEERHQPLNRTTIACFNCGEEGHRIRDCSKPRQNRFACRNCGQTGHQSSECTEPRQCPPDMECRKCGGQGHFAKDCLSGGGDDQIQCRNCDEYGHKSRDCPKPRDYSRIVCSNCGEKGHTKVRCKNAPAEGPSDIAGADYDAGGFDNAGLDNAGFHNAGFDNADGQDANNYVGGWDHVTTDAW